MPSTDVLLRVYAKCISERQHEAKRRIEPGFARDCSAAPAGLLRTLTRSAKPQGQLGELPHVLVDREGTD